MSKKRGVTQPAAAPHNEKSTININSFFQRGNAEFLSRFKSLPWARKFRVSNEDGGTRWRCDIGLASGGA